MFSLSAFRNQLPEFVLFRLSVFIASTFDVVVVLHGNQINQRAHYLLRSLRLAPPPVDTDFPQTWPITTVYLTHGVFDEMTFRGASFMYFHEQPTRFLAPIGCRSNRLRSGDVDP